MNEASEAEFLRLLPHQKLRHGCTEVSGERKISASQGHRFLGQGIVERNLTSISLKRRGGRDAVVNVRRPQKPLLKILHRNLADREQGGADALPPGPLGKGRSSNGQLIAWNEFELDRIPQHAHILAMRDDIAGDSQWLRPRVNLPLANRRKHPR